MNYNIVYSSQLNSIRQLTEATKKYLVEDKRLKEGIDFKIPSGCVNEIHPQLIRVNITFTSGPVESLHSIDPALMQRGDKISNVLLSVEA